MRGGAGWEYAYGNNQLVCVDGCFLSHVVCCIFSRLLPKPLSLTAGALTDQIQPTSNKQASTGIERSNEKNPKNQKDQRPNL
jgi:hypothetical protein